MILDRTIFIVVFGFLAALWVNLAILPSGHIISSLYLIPVLIACHFWRPRAVAGAAAIAILLYLLTARIEQRPVTVWPFGVLALLMGGYLTVQFAKHRHHIAQLAQREAEDRRRLQMFIGMVAHDLAGAMTNALAGIELLRQLRRQDVSAEERIAIEAIVGGTDQMQRLFDDLRDAAAIGAGQFRVQSAVMDLVELVQQVLEQQRAKNPRHRFVLAAPARLQGEWDRERLVQLVTNLVSNACKYSPDGGEVRVAVDVASDVVTIGVRDQGIGIDKKNQELIFEPFARVQSRDDIPGTGLGLWIAKAIVEAHGGRIWVESETGKGSTFVATLQTIPRVDTSLKPQSMRHERIATPTPATLQAAVLRLGSVSR